MLYVASPSRSCPNRAPAAGSKSVVVSVVPYLAGEVAIGGALCGLGMSNALIGSYARLPLAMARDGILPSGWRARSRTGAPTRSILLDRCAAAACWDSASADGWVEIDCCCSYGAVRCEVASLIIFCASKPPPCASRSEFLGVPVVAALIGCRPVMLPRAWRCGFGRSRRRARGFFVPPGSGGASARWRSDLLSAALAEAARTSTPSADCFTKYGTQSRPTTAAYRPKRPPCARF